MLTRWAIGEKLGGGNWEKIPAVVAGVERYILMCTANGGNWVAMMAWSGLNTYKFVRHLFNDASEREYEDVTTGANEENVWKAKAEEAKAIRNYAEFHKLAIKHVKLDDIEAAEGVKHWAEFVAEVVPEETKGKGKDKGKGKGKDKGKGKEKGKGKGKDPTKGGDVVISDAVLEKNLKEALGVLQNCEKQRKEWQTCYEEDTDKHSWTASFLKDIGQVQDSLEVDQKTLDPFAHEFREAAISTTQLKELKKQYPKDYGHRVQQYLKLILPVVDNIKDKLQKLKEIKIINDGVPSAKKARRSR